MNQTLINPITLASPKDTPSHPSLPSYGVPPLQQQFKLMQKESQGARGKTLQIPRYADKYKDMLQQSAKKQKPEPLPQPPTQSDPPQRKSFFFYKIRTIGVGAHSFVSLVQQEETKMLLAQKAVTLAHARQVREDLMREIKILALCQHENIIKLYHWYSSESHLNLLLEYAEDSLFALKQKFGVFKEKEVVEVVRQLLNGLAYLHSRNIVHADVKLENIVIANGTVKLCDFGYAHLHRSGQSREGELVGTLEYLPPEYAQGVDSGPKRDIWAVGMLAFQMLAGGTPFEGLKQNEKWSKLIKTAPEAYLQQLVQRQKSKHRHSERVAELMTHIFCHHQCRWSAQRLLSLGLFLPPQ